MGGGALWGSVKGRRVSLPGPEPAATGHPPPLAIVLVLSFPSQQLPRLRALGSGRPPPGAGPTRLPEPRVLERNVVGAGRGFGLLRPIVPCGSSEEPGLDPPLLLSRGY